MKAKRRHQLQTNVLADWLGKQGESIAPYWTTILVALLVAVIGGGLVSLMLNSQSSSLLQSGDWSSFLEANAETDDQLRGAALVEVAQQQRVTSAGLWARQLAADEQLNRGVELLYSDRSQAEKVLHEAESNYQEILNRKPEQRLLRHRARFGLAQVYESLGNLEEASDNYRQLARDAIGTMFGRQAERRLNLLVDPSTNELRAEMVAFHEAFTEYEPPPQEPPSDAGAFQHPPIDIVPLPDRPDLSFPGSEAYDESSDENSSGDESTGDQPTTDPSSGDSPASDPSDEESAPDDAPQ